MKKSVTALLIAATLLPVPPSAAEPQVAAESTAADPQPTAINSERYMDLVGEADSFISAEDWAGAESSLKSALRLEPANPANQLLLSNLGLVLLQQSKYGDAERHLDVALQLNPNSYIARKYRAMLRMRSGESDGALEDLNRALELDSTDNSLRNLRGFLFLAKGDTEKASADFLKVLDSADKNVEALEGLVECSTATGSRPEAITFLSRLIEIEPKPAYLFARGVIRAKSGNYTDASLDVTEGLKADPQNGNLHLLKAFIEHSTYRINEAKDSYEKARRYGADPQAMAALFPNGL